jgi:hypothetical protein
MQAFARAASAIPQRHVEIHLRAAERRHHPEEHPGDHRDTEHEQQRRAVERQGDEERRRLAGKGEAQQAYAPAGDEHADRAAEQRDEKTLGHELTPETRARCPERGADGDLP